MSTLEYTVSLLKMMPEDKLREVQKYIQYLIFLDRGDMPIESLSEDVIVQQLIDSMRKSDMGVTTSANIVSQQMKEKYAI
ncbi:MAG: hypothetical protein NC321_05800 [Clostridium sp.]|nr:hypothetical protein [Clostridium sp.]